ncbi:MAG: hypothetical protein GY711_29890 [bacterium]|nr:hypothetical protein [bacterium]
MRLPIQLIPLALLSAPAVHAGDVLVVGAGEPYATVQGAVLAAADGDTVLIRAGTYGGAAVANKSLRLVADDAGVVRLTEPVRVFQLDAGKEVLLSGLESTFEIRHCDGIVTLNRCGSPAPFHTPAHTPVTVQVENCTRVVFAGGTFHGQSAALPGGSFEEPSGADAMQVTGSSVSLYGTTLRGGDGADALGYLCFGCTDGGDGGHGLVLAQGSVADHADLDSQGGDGGAWGGSDCCFEGTDGLPFWVTGGSELRPVPAHTARLSSNARVVRDGDVVAMSFGGVVGDVAVLFVSPTAGFRSIAPGYGFLHVGNPYRTADVLGRVPVSGTIAFTRTAGGLGGAESVSAYWQVMALTYDSNRSPLRVMSNPVAWVVVDPVF